MQPLDTATISQADYARRRGVTRQAVAAAVAAGRLTTFGPDKRIHPVLADQEWQANTRARVSHVASPPATAAAAAPTAAATAPSYDTSRARREAATAEIAELQLAREIGAVVGREEIFQSFAEAIVIMRSAFEAMPARLALRLAGEVHEDAVQAILADDVTRILGELARRFAAMADAYPGQVSAPQQQAPLGLDGGQP